MINISIKGETVTIKEQTSLTELIPIDTYAVEMDNRVALAIPKEIDTPEDLDKMNLYVAGIVTADNLGYMETICEKITFDGLKWDPNWFAWLGVYIENGNFASLNSKAGIKVFFGRR